MKGKLLYALLILALLCLLDYGGFRMRMYFTPKSRLSVLFVLCYIVLFFLFIENFIYNLFYSFRSSTWKIFLFIGLPWLLAVFISIRWITISNFYLYAKTQVTVPSPGLWQPDPWLSHKGVPGKTGYYNIFPGPGMHGTIPVMYDAKGFRTVPAGLRLHSDTTDLYLGCSFTFGEYIRAEEGFPYQAAKFLQHDVLNAGVPAYGLAHMKLLLDSLLARDSFKFVFIQLSPWLADRAMQLSGPTKFGYRPFPYFVDSGRGFNLHPPAFRITPEAPGQWRNSPLSYSERIRFAFTEGREKEISDYFSRRWAGLLIFLGLEPGPTKRKRELENYFYQYAVNACKQRQCIPVILKLRYPADQCRSLLDSLAGKAMVIDLDEALESYASQSGKTFSALYSVYFANGKDTIIYDAHPNPLANAIIAKKIAHDILGQDSLVSVFHK